MADITWGVKYALGVRAIDDEHKQLFDSVGELESAAARNAAPAETDALLKKLVAASGSHFAEEERAMQAARYPGLALHAANHKRLMQKVEAFAARHTSGGPAVNQHALNFLRDWLLYHIENDDMRLGAWWKEHKDG